MTDLRLQLTSSAFPEQYDVFNKDDVLVGYMRLRHGYFYADAYRVGTPPEVQKNTTVYDAHPVGYGNFEDHERQIHLDRALDAISRRIADTTIAPTHLTIIAHEIRGLLNAIESNLIPMDDALYTKGRRTLAKLRNLLKDNPYSIYVEAADLAYMIKISTLLTETQE